MSHSKISLTEILSSSSLFGKIVKKVEEISKLNTIVQEALDPKLAAYCRVANVRDGILILTTHSSSYGNLLRYAEVELLTRLRSDPNWCHLKSIKTCVRPPMTHAQKPPQVNKPTLTESNSTCIQATAHYIHEPALRQALERLAKRTPVST